MSETTAFHRLAGQFPSSETQWREIASQAHRLRGEPGDEALAKTHEQQIQEIRKGLVTGTSRQLRLCPRCLERGVRYALLLVAGLDRCGTCGWPDPAPSDADDFLSPT